MRRITRRTSEIILPLTILRESSQHKPGTILA
jgi:hypothetical protein